MLTLNWAIVFATSIIPLLIGMLWYNRILFGNAWLQASGQTVDDSKKVNMLKVSAIAILLGAFLAMCLVPMTIHQFHVGSIFANDASIAVKTSARSLYLADFYKTNADFRTFKHGAFHGILNGILLGSAFVGMSAMFERKSFKYVLIHVGYWVVCMAIMGGIICGFA